MASLLAKDQRTPANVRGHSFGSGGGPLLGPEGFTLIELLVVISIMGMLISLLMPVIEQARQTAIATLCRSNLRQIGLGVTLYADDNATYIPPYLKHSSHQPYPWLSDMAYDTNLVPYNLAFAFESAHIPDPAVFYCPSQRLVKHNSKTAYERPWGTVPGAPATDNIRIGYYYNPHVDGAHRRIFHHMDDFPNVVAVTMDLLVDPERVPHQPGWHMLFVDGSVRLQADQSVYHDLVGLNYIAFIWPAFENLRDRLQQQ